MFSFGLVTISHFCSDCNGNTFESSGKNSLVGSPNCLVRVQTKDSKEVTFFRVFQFQFFSRLWAEKNPAVLSKPKYMCREERMKNEVLIRSSLIPKNLLAIGRRYFGFRLKHFSMADDTAFYAFKERIQQELFRNNFCFSIVTGLWVKLFLIFGRIFPRGCH